MAEEENCKKKITKIYSFFKTIIIIDEEADNP